MSPSGQQSRRTDRRTLEIFAMAALGIENFLYVELLQKRGIDAIGLWGASGRLLLGRKKNVRAVQAGKVVLLRDDHTGTIDEVNVDLLRAHLAEKRIPVIAPLAMTPEGDALNVDGDRAAARIAAALGARELLLITNVPGLLRDVGDRSSVVPRATLEEADSFAQGRMKKKVMAAREAIAAGINEVRIRSTASDGTRIDA